MGLELVPDPDFNDPAAWDITTTAGSAVISGGKLTCTNWKGNIEPVGMAAPSIGTAFSYEVVIDSTDAVGLQAVQYGGAGLWAAVLGAGTWTEENTGLPNVTISTSAANIAIAFTAGNMVISRVSIMADAREEQILAAVTTAVTGLTTTGANVFRGRSYPLSDADLPGLVVYMGPDAPDVELFNNYIDWSLGVGIEAYVYTSSATIDTELAQIRKEVHTAIMTTPQFGLSFVIDTAPISAAEPEIDGDGAKRTGRRRFEFVVRYRSSRTDISA